MYLRGAGRVLHWMAAATLWLASRLLSNGIQSNGLPALLTGLLWERKLPCKFEAHTLPRLFRQIELHSEALTAWHQS
jgi:hypothetical protein